MTKRRVVLTLVLCSSMALLAVQALSQTRTSRASAAERSAGMTAAERKREIEKWRRETKLARERRKMELKKRSAERKRQDVEKAKEAAKEGRGTRGQRLKIIREEAAERRKEFMHQKAALGASEEQWKLIKVKLEKVRQLRGQANSAVGVFLAGSIGSEPSSRTGARANAPAWQWKGPWEGKAPDELTEAQRLARQLITLVGRNSTTSQAFRSRMAALRKARSEEAELNRQLSEARRELRDLLTPRQEAALVLMKRL